MRKCMWSSPETIKSNCASLKKFYRCMFENGRISRESFDSVCEFIREEKTEWVKEREEPFG